MELLLSHGADVNMQNNEGFSPLMITSKYGHSDVITILLDKGAEVNMQSNNGWSSLMAACKNGHNDVVKTLLEKGAKVNLQNYHGWSSLIAASHYGHNDIVNTLLDKGAEVNMQDYDGWSSLMIASWGGHGNIVKTLLDNHADVSIRNKNGKDALNIVTKRGHKYIVELFSAVEQGSNDSPLTPATVQQSTIHTTSQTDEQYKDGTSPDTLFQGALDESELSPLHNQEEESRDLLKSSSEPYTLGASNIIPEDVENLTEQTSTIRQKPPIKASLGNLIVVL